MEAIHRQILVNFALRVLALCSLAMPAWAAPALSISPLGYRLEQVMQVTGVSRTYDVTARAGVANTGDAATNVAARITSSINGVIVLDGDVSFGNVAKTTALKSVISIDTFKLRFVLPTGYNFSNYLTYAQTVLNSLAWTISCGNCGQNRAPLAKAGADQTVYVAQLVTLDGSGSSDADGNALTYRWSVVSKPADSAVSLYSLSAVKPTFTPDRAGNYVFQLIVNDGTVDSAPASVTITTLNSAPVANAGADQTATVGTHIYLNGAASTDIDGNALTYQWNIIGKPAGSNAMLLNADPASPLTDFILDKPGSYLVALVVNDGQVNSTSDTVIVSTINSAPVANAGLDQTVRLGATVDLSGAASFDLDGNALSYRWALTTPAGSLTILTTSVGVSTGFVVDKRGTYVAQLIVNDGVIDSTADTVVISTINSTPVANAGADLNAYVGDTVTLDGFASNDVDNDFLSFTWALLSQPLGSVAAFNSPYAPITTFVPDVVGLYVVQLVVNDGHVDSAPDTARITIEVQPDRTPPVIFISNPAEGVYTNVNPYSVTGNLSESATLTINGQAATLNEFNQFSLPLTLMEGVNTLAFVATDPSSNRATAARHITLDTIVPHAANLSLMQITDAGSGAVTVIGVNDSVEANAKVRITNSRTGISVIVAANAQGAFSASLAAQAGDALAVVVLDAANNVSDAKNTSVPIPAGTLALSVAQPLDGAITAGYSVLVTGTVTGADDAGITVSGLVASVSQVGATLTFAALVPLEAGANTLIVNVQTLDGRSTTRALTITRSGAVPFDVVATPTIGMQPLEVRFDVAQYGLLDAATMRIDYDGDGTFDEAFAASQIPASHTYYEPGNHLVRVSVTDTTGNSYLFQIPVTINSVEQLDNKLRALWTSFAAALTTRDTEKAKTFISEQSVESYARIFDELKDKLPSIVTSMSALEAVALRNGFAEYAVSRVIDGEQRVFFIDFMQDSDGVWRIEGM